MLSCYVIEHNNLIWTSKRGNQWRNASPALTAAPEIGFL